MTDTTVQPHIPEGYLMNAAGHLVPVSTIKDIDMARNDLVLEFVARAEQLQEKMRDFKLSALGDVQAFVELSAEKYDVQIGGRKGNVQLTSFDGKYRLTRSIQDQLSFDERLKAAKALIDNCIHRWAQGSAEEIKALVEHAFQVDKEGNISTARVLGLRRLDIQDDEWQKAMQAIADSIQVTGSQTYIRLHKRVGESDQWQAIPLDMAKL
ncbi:DUF3164 family protein [Marinobacterium stanieri]|uniref:Sulfate transporter n=1 Tax=Marinobacterium stanieri TaxID=49186 RepID=A0A1N6RMU1_9GAMM|nr:DUF3164 family protein [Marinobacterium stanieri]SIQ30210.1 Protein of unknown function [Marinobacterium stanieri]